METQSKWQQFVHIVSELEFITSTFSWIFNLLSRIAEPLMTLAVIYTIVVAGLPQARVPALYNIALAVMIGAPEVILPGAFIMAGQQQRGGNKRAWMLFGVCLLFVLLTSLTLADLFIFHFDEIGTSVLMCARCVTGVSYSILVRVVSHEQHSHQPRSSQAFDPHAFMNQVLNQVSQMNQQLIQDIQHSLEQFMNQVTERSQENMSTDLVQTRPARTLALEAIAKQQSANQVVPARGIQTAVRSEPLSSRDCGDAEPGREAVHEALEVRQAGSAFTLREETKGENEDVHETSDVQTETRVHERSEQANVGSSGKVNREQVCVFILNHWREHRARPAIKLIRERTGCSQGLASECCRLVAQEMNA